MKQFNIPKNPYDEREMFEKSRLVLEDNSISCLVGCNGSGKSTILFFIQQQLEKRGAYELRGKFCDLRGVFGKEKYNDELFYIFDKRSDVINDEMGDLMNRLSGNMASTGENILNRFGRGLQLLGGTIGSGKANDKSLYLFIDDCDAGTSLDMINDIKSVFNLIIKDCKKRNITYYIILTANSYELCKDLDCISVCDFSHKRFESYEDYKKFVFESRKYKDKTLGVKE